MFTARHRRILATVAVTILAAVVLAACGSGSSSTTTTSTSTTAASVSGAGSSSQRAAITACLKSNGITVPSRPSGSAATPNPNRASGGGLFGGAVNGSTPNNSKVRAALEKCGITLGQRPASASRANNPAFQSAVNNYVACMAKNGYPLPKPNFSGKGPVFSTSQVNRNDAKFKAANTTCQALLTVTQTTGSS